MILTILRIKILNKMISNQLKNKKVKHRVTQNKIMIKCLKNRKKLFLLLYKIIKNLKEKENKELVSLLLLIRDLLLIYKEMLLLISKIIKYNKLTHKCKEPLQKIFLCIKSNLSKKNIIKIRQHQKKGS